VIKIKTWRKLVWSKSRAFIQIRLSDCNFAGLKIGKPYLYGVLIPKQGQMIINFKRAKK
jgi:hypothetical protein